MSQNTAKRFDGIYRATISAVVKTWQNSPWRRPVLILVILGTIFGSSAFFYSSLEQSEASSHKFMAFWDGATPPSGWVCVSCTGGDDFYQVFPRGAATAGGTGGAATHDHSQSFVSHTNASTTTTNRSGQTNFTLDTHTHGYTGDLSGRTATATSLPVYQNLKIIRYDTAGNPPNIPDGVIVMFDATPGSGWTRYTAQDGDMIRGENDATGTGGSATHTHTFSGTLTDSANDDGRTGASTTAATAAHTHTVSGTTDASDHTPTYRDVLLYKNTSGSAKALAGGEIFMATGAPGTGWTSLSGSGGDFENRFLRGASTYGGTGGASTHTPANDTNTSTGASASAGTVTGNPQTAFGGASHTHDVTNSFGSGDNLPPYRDTIIAKKDVPAGITVSGGCFTDETEGTACTDDGSNQIKVAVNGTVDSGVDTVVDGSWSFTIAQPNTGDILVFFIDGEATETEEATTVVKYDGAGNVDLVKMYQSQLVIGTDSGSVNTDQTITVADLDTTTNGYENSDDEDVLYDVTAGADLTVDAEGNKSEQLYIINGDTYRPASGGGSDTFYDACQNLTVGTNAAGGYSTTVKTTARPTSGSNTISEGTCDGGCSDTVAAAWATATNNGYGYCLKDEVGDGAVTSGWSGTNECGDGTQHFKTINRVDATESGQSIMASAVATSTNDQTEIGYRIAVGAGQAAGTYTTVIIYVTTPTF